MVNVKGGLEILFYSIVAQYLLATAKHTWAAYSANQALPKPLEGYAL